MSILEREAPFYYSEVVPTVIEELKIYYDVYWTYSDVELLCGCSRTTVKKYFEGYTKYIRPSTWDILKTFPLSDNRFYTPWFDNDVIFTATSKGIKELKPKEVEIKTQTIQQPQLENLLYKQIDSTKIPETPGIYMLANISTPLYDLSKKHFLIKVGMSTTNLRNRVKTYFGMNPLTFIVDYKTTSNGINASELEKSWHTILAKKAICNVSSPEWFEMHFEDFKELIKKGLH